MPIKVAINGYGRIGRNILRALYESDYRDRLQIVGVNDMGDLFTAVHLTRYDSVHGRFPGHAEISGDHFMVNGDTIHFTSDRDPHNLPWKELDVDVVFECTGVFTTREKASAHLAAGAKKVLISAPGKTDVDATVVYGVNHDILKPEFDIISNASCTTNCLAPLVKPLHEKLGIVSGLMTTVHAYTNDQRLTDVHHKDIRRARAATLSMIPTSTGAAKAVGLVLPELAGKLDGLAVRVPVANVSLVDLTFEASTDTSVEAVHEIIREASENDLKGILIYNDEPLVSIDFNHNPASSIYEASQTKVCGNLVKVLAWYDNEWGFCNRMLDTTLAWMSGISGQ